MHITTLLRTVQWLPVTWDKTHVLHCGLPGPAQLSDTGRGCEVLAEDEAEILVLQDKLESDITSCLIIVQISWMSSLTLFNQQRNGNSDLQLS